MNGPSQELIEAIEKNPALLDELLWQNCQRQIMEKAPPEIQDELNKLKPDEPTPPELQARMTKFAQEYIDQFYKEVQKVMDTVCKKNEKS
jgi:hypothetical protein